MGVVLHQIAAGAAPRDAITNHLLRSRDLLRSQGWESEIFAEHIHPELADLVHPIQTMSPPPGAAAILHYSINSAAFELAMEKFDRTALHYHNITPADLLWRHAPGVARACVLGRRELARFARAVDHACADSEFNAEELRAAGAEGASAVGILRREFDGGVMAAERPAPDSAEPQLLFVGRGIPNKAQHDLILSIAALHEAACPARLQLIGSWDAAPAYERWCHELVRGLGLESHVSFSGSLSDVALRSAYEAADLLLCLSDHEVFCVPLLEALEVGLPIVAFDAGAVAETLGPAGLVLPSKEPSLVAEAVMAVVSDPSLRTSFRHHSYERLEHFSSRSVSDRLVRFARQVMS